MPRALIALGPVVLALAFGCKPASDSAPQPTPDPVAGPAVVLTVGQGGLALTPENTKIEWTGTKPNGKHVGGFARFAGSISPGQGDPAANTINVEIDTDSISSDDPRLTNHLKSFEFFDVKKYPKATFVSTKIEESKDAGATHRITGDLTLHGITKPITFPARLAKEGDNLTLESTFTFDRTDYGISYRPDAVDKVVTVRLKGKVPLK
jgi:polyisoprenoid-binding protein YceI